MTSGTRAWRIFNLAVLVVSLGFLVWAIAGTGVTSDQAWRDPALLATVGLAGCLYAVALLFVAAGWLALVRSASPGTRLGVRTGLRIYGLSQLYKYLPSNLLHYVGRHAALRQAGIGHLPAALGGFGEIALLVPAALLTAAVAGPLGGLPVDDRVGTATLAVLGVIVTIGLVVAIASPMLRRHPRTAEPFQALLSAPVRRAAGGAFVCYLLFFAGSSATFAFVASHAGPWHAGDAMGLAAIWTAAWVLGFVVPGAPGGLGVREAVLIAGLSPAAGLDGAALVALAMRLATVIGDLLLAAAGYAAGAGGRARPVR